MYAFVKSYVAARLTLPGLASTAVCAGPMV